MVTVRETNYSVFGKCAMITDGKTEVYVTLDIGPRIIRYAVCGKDNMMWENTDLDVGNKGEDFDELFYKGAEWKIYGGHRMWLAPESDASYYPDNEPVSYTITGNSVLVEQKRDPWTGIRKQLRLTFRENAIDLENIFINDTDQMMEGGSWGVNSLSGGGVAKIDFAGTDPGDYVPRRVVSLWADTNIHDPRLQFTKHSLTATQLPLEDYFKLGLYCDPGKAVYENKGQRFILTFGAYGIENHPDNGCNFELYLAKEFMELETLGIKRCLLPGEAASHTETWQLEKL